MRATHWKRAATARIWPGSAKRDERWMYVDGMVAEPQRAAVEPLLREVLEADRLGTVMEWQHLPATVDEGLGQVADLKEKLLHHARVP